MVFLPLTSLLLISSIVISDGSLEVVSQAERVSHFVRDQVGQQTGR